jgi:hypothetical protein
MNRVYPTPQAARAAALGPFDFWACSACGFGWNRAFDPDLIVYDEDYENDQTHSPAFLAHVRERAAEVVAAAPVGEALDYLEIGCGQGVFIGEVARAAGARLATAEGFDPAWRGADGDGPNGARIHKVYFDAATAGRLTRAPNVVASRHTIEHVPDPPAFLKSLREALGEASTARVFIETPCLAWILDHEAMQDFFYEHCSVFTAGSLRHALQRSGFEVDAVRHVFGGQYLWASARAARNPDVTPLDAGAGSAAPMQGAQARFTARWRSAVRAARADGPVAIWGAGAKGVTFALLVDPDGGLIDHAIDINTAKQGQFMPLTGLEVRSPDGSAARTPATIFVMNPNYLEEISQIAASAGLAARLVAVD